MSGAADRARVFRLFDEALAREGPARQEWLAGACAGDDDLRAAVEELLRAEGSGPADTRPATDELAQVAGRVFGRFRALEPIARGGMGAVFRAERTDNLAQKVALKLLRGGALGLAARFTREMQTLARLQHPAVAQLIDAGVEADGTAWIAMELVEGAPIDAWCEARAVPLRERVRLLAEVADAVAFAHRSFVVHRDIKPGNVLVSSAGQPKLIDFGIAKLLDEGAGATAATREGGPLFTPQYAAPEQVSGGVISAATDVFGLGALGYRLLAGQALFPEAQSALGYLVAVAQRDPKPASRAAHERGDEAAARQLRGDLDTILARALAREPARRYQAASELRDDLRRFLQHRPVLARPQSLAYRAGKFLRRNPAATALAAVVVLGASASAVALGWQAQRLARERDTARAAVARAERINGFLTRMLQSSDPGAGGARDATVAEVLDKAAREASALAAQEPQVAADLLRTIAQADLSLGRYQQALDATAAALPLLRAQPGASREAALALVDLCSTHWSLGKNADAEPACREAVALLPAAPAGDQADADARGRARDQLGVILANSNREREAEAEYRAALADFARAGVDGGPLCVARSNLGVLLGNLGRLDESNDLLSGALAECSRAYAADHPRVLGVMLNLAGNLEAAGKRAEAVPLYQKVIDARRRVLGPDHRDTLWAQTSAASNLSEMGRFGEAFALADRSGRALEASLGEAHPLTAFAQIVAGYSLCSEGRTAEGLVSLRRAEAARVKLYGERNWLVANTRTRIGQCLARAGRRAEAEQTLLSAARALEEVRGPAFERTQDAFRALRDLYSDWGRKDEAAKFTARLARP